jgi:hypothetical protein
MRFAAELRVRLDDCDRLDLDELVGIAQERDTEECARRSTEACTDHVPNTRELGALLGHDEDRRLDKRFRPGGMLSQRSEKVLDSARCLQLAVARRYDTSFLIERAGPCGKDESAGGDAVGVGRVWVEAHRRSKTISTAPLATTSRFTPSLTGRCLLEASCSQRLVRVLPVALGAFRCAR